MSATIKLSSRLPGDPEINGLDQLQNELLEDPTQVVCAIAWIKVRDVRRIIEAEPGRPAQIPTIEIARIEPIDVIDRVPAAVTTLAAELYEKRTGRNPLPFDQVVGTGDHVVYSTSTSDDDGEPGLDYDADF